MVKHRFYLLCSQNIGTLLTCGELVFALIEKQVQKVDVFETEAHAVLDVLLIGLVLEDVVYAEVSLFWQRDELFIEVLDSVLFHIVEFVED